MSRTRITGLLFAAAFGLLAPQSSQATITVYTTEASYLAAIANPGVDTYNDLPGAAVSSPLSRATAGNVYSYTATATDGFFPAGTSGDRWLSTNEATNSIVMSSFSSGVVGVGGFFFTTDINGAFDAGDIVVAATDASGNVSQTIVGSTTSSFRGFVSTTGITGFTVTSVQPTTGFLWPTINNLTLGTALAPQPPTNGVPEPGTMGLAAMGAVAALAAARRKARRA